MHPLARRLSRGERRCRSEFAIWRLWFPFFFLFPCASLVWMFVCMYACLPALVRLFRSCRDPAKYYRELRIASAWRVLDTWECAMSMYPTRGTGSTVYIHSQERRIFSFLSFSNKYVDHRFALFVRRYAFESSDFQSISKQRMWQFSVATGIL